MQSELSDKLRYLAQSSPGPFYAYVTERIAARCQAFAGIAYEPKSIHFATMANASPRFLRLVRRCGMQVFVNSTSHLQLAQQLGWRGSDIVFTASAMDRTRMRAAHEAGAIVNLDSLGQLAVWRELHPGSAVGIRCNIGDLVEPRATRGGFFLGRESRLGLTLDEIESLEGARDINGLHVYVGTDILELDYFQACYAELVRLAGRFPVLNFIDFGGGFGLPRDNGDNFPIERYGHYVTELMTHLSADLGRPIRLILEPGRIIGGEAGYFVCRVTDVKQRHGMQLIGVDASSVQFPRPLLYPDDAHHPVEILPRSSPFAPVLIPSSIYGCSTYSRDFLARDLGLPAAQVGDLVVFGQAGSYCAAAHTQFLGFAEASDFYL